MTNKMFYYRIKATDTIESLCRTLNTEKDNILRNNADIPLYSGEWVKIMVNDFIWHIVKPTETLESVAETYGISKDKIITDNNLTIEKLYIGESLKIYKDEKIH